MDSGGASEEVENDILFYEYLAMICRVDDF